MVLADLDRYGLSKCDAVHSAIMANQIPLALRLIQRFEAESEEKLSFKRILAQFSTDEHRGNIMHTLSRLENVKRTELHALLSSLVTKNDESRDFVIKRDDLGASSIHYACARLNFDFIDFMHQLFPDLLKQKDASQQTAFSLLFWQIGRVTYSSEHRVKIKAYANKSLNENIELLGKACFALSSPLDPGKLSKIINDYPRPKEYNSPFLSPLIFAITKQDVTMSTFLVKDLGFDVNASDLNKSNALAYAVRTNNSRLVHILLNPDYEPVKEVIPQHNHRAKHKASARMKMLQLKVDDEEGDEEDEEEATEDETSVVTHDESLTESISSSFRLKSNLILNQMDNKLRTVFHHLALSLDFGSFHNVDIFRLLANVFSSVDQDTKKSKLPPLADFLKRVDSNVLTAADYALKNSNLPLYEEMMKAMGKSSVNIDEQKLTRFSVVDKFYQGLNSKPNYMSDAELLLKSSSLEEYSAESFEVDTQSGMAKIGRLVYDEKTKIPFDVVLTKTDVSYGLYGMHNFYKMQLILPRVDSAICVLFTRWGRIGDQGQHQRTPFASVKEARDEFCKIFKQKTANDFTETVLEKRKLFDLKPKRYNLVKLESRSRPKLADVDFELECGRAVFDKSLFASAGIDYFKFFADLLDANYIKNCINLTHLSNDYLPLARLSREAIDKATDILNKKLKPLIERRMELEKLNKKENLVEYMSILEQINRFSNEYYELIPQMDYKYERLSPVSTEREMDEQLGLMSKLNMAQIAIRILMGAKQSSLTQNPFDYVYNSINAKLELLDPSCNEAQYIIRYAQPSRDSSAHVKRIFKFERPGEQERFERVKLSSKTPKLKNRVLLWHGTNSENMISIMFKGLLKAHYESKLSGQRYGRGIYFSDVFAASKSYCSGRSSKTEQGSYASRNYMLLCEVALGEVKELRSTYESVETLPEGFDSVKALGREEPSPEGDVFMPNGSLIPIGDIVETKNKHGCFGGSQYTQYVVYDEAQVCIRYIVQFNQ